MKNFFAFVLALALLISSLPLAVAAGEGTTGDYLKDIGTKFGRGLVNVVTSPVDIPCTMADEMADHPSTGFFTGFGKGAVFMLRRILVGVTEVGTFVIPMERTIPPVCHEEVK